MSIADVAGARAALERLDALAHALRDPLHLHFVVGWQCMFAQLDGRLEEAETLALESYEMRRALQTRDAEGVLAAQLFMIRRAQGRVAELLPAVEQAIAQYPALAAWRAGLPLVLIAAGEEDRARAELLSLDLAAIPPDFFWLVAMSMLAEATAALRAPPTRSMTPCSPTRPASSRSATRPATARSPASSACSAPRAATRPRRSLISRPRCTPAPARRPCSPAPRPSWLAPAQERRSERAQLAYTAGSSRSDASVSGGYPYA